MNIYKAIENEVKAAVAARFGEGLALEKIEATPSRDAAHGDIATNAAMVVAPQVKKNPREIAAQLAEAMAQKQDVTKAEVAGPGFINLTLRPESWQAVIPVILSQGVAYGDSAIGAGRKVNVEYVSANPTGPMHVGHGRGAVFGDALAALMSKAGFDVTREYYINDAGAQIDKLAESAFLRYREALGENIGEIPEGFYPGEYLKRVGKELAEAYGAKLRDMPREEWLSLVRNRVVISMMGMIRDDLAALGIYHSVFSSERTIVERGLVDEALALLEVKGLLYTGVLEPPKGKTPEDWEPRPQLLFRSTEFGDDCDRPLKKSDGSWTYLTPDIGYHLDKIRRGFTLLVNVLGADHAGYVKRITAAVAALSDRKVTLEAKLCQLVKFMRAGEPLKMSKRAGTFVTVREVVDEVGKDVFRFIMLTRKNDQALDFDFEKVLEQSKDNPVFYVQYAHARCHSVLRNAAQEMPEAMAARADLLLLSSAEELSLLKLMAGWPRLVEGAALSAEPHRVAFYLQELAASFHALWNKGNTDNRFRFLRKDAMELTAARLMLTRALAMVIASGLTVLGVQPLEEMR